MKKHIYAIIGFALAHFTAASGTETDHDHATYMECDFESGIPADFATYDQDGSTLYFTMIQAGFKQGDAWISKREEGASPTNYYAASTSKYKVEDGETASPSDDWIVTPQVCIRAADAIMSWRACSFCEQSKKGDRYKVLVSTTGNSPEDFTEAPIFSTDAESVNEWSRHEVSLEAYAGKYIRIAFVNCMTDGEILGIDDLTIEGGKGLSDLKALTPEYIYGQQSFKIEASITAHSDESISEFTAYYSHDGQTASKTFENLDIKKGTSFDFSFDETIPVEYGETIRYDLWAEVNGNPAVNTLHQSTTALLFNPSRRIVVEEGTGMWCTYCPIGIVAMRELHRKYPDTFIGISLHYEDKLEIDNYPRLLRFPGFPSGLFNRKEFNTTPMVLTETDGIPAYTTLEGGFETAFLQAASEQAIADIGMTARLNGDNITATAQTRFAMPISEADCDIAFVVIEDNVCHDDYYQTNGYSGSEVPIGGFEALPERIKPFTFDEVARYVHSDYQGIEGSLPETIIAGETYESSYTFNLPENIDDRNETSVIAMLIDRQSGEILNAAIAKLALSEGIEDSAISSNAPTLKYDANDRTAVLSTSDTEPVTFNVYDIYGNTAVNAIAEAHSGHAVLNLAGLPKGFYIITARQTRHFATIKTTTP